MQVEKFGILLSQKFKFKKSIIANFGFSEVCCIIVTISVVFFFEVVVLGSCCA